MIRLGRWQRPTEDGLIAAVDVALAHCPDVMVRNIRNEDSRKRGRVKRGTPDFLGLVMRARGAVGLRGYSQPLAIETKMTHGLECGRKGCSCESQRDFRKDWESRGGLYVLANSVQGVLDGIFGRRSM